MAHAHAVRVVLAGDSVVSRAQALGEWCGEKPIIPRDGAHLTKVYAKVVVQNLAESVPSATATMYLRGVGGVIVFTSPESNATTTKEWMETARKHSPLAVLCLVLWGKDPDAKTRKEAQEMADEYEAMYLEMESLDVSIASVVRVVLWKGDSGSVASSEEKTEPSRDASRAVIEGPIRKRGMWNKAWRQRDLALFANELVYFRPLERTPRGCIVVSRIVSVEEMKPEPPEGFCFNVETKSRKYIFAAQSDKDRNDWIREIREAVRKAPKERERKASWFRPHSATL